MARIKSIKIHDAIRLLECQLFPIEKQTSCHALLQDVNEEIGIWAGKIEQLTRAPAAVQEDAKQKLTRLRNHADELAQELAFVKNP